MTSAVPDHRRYVSETVWLPTYAAVVVLVLAGFSGSWVAIPVMFIALVASRMVLELLYRLVLGPARLALSTGLVAFAAQLVVWFLVWGWLAQRSPT